MVGEVAEAGEVSEDEVEEVEVGETKEGLEGEQKGRTEVGTLGKDKEGHIRTTSIYL